MKATFVLKGFDGLDRALAELGPKVARNVAGKALRAGARVIRDEAKARVPVLTGDLKKSLKVRTRKPKAATERGVVVGVAGSEGPLAHLVEFGSRPHQTRPGVMHPGTPPRPFLRAAADVKAGEALQAIGRVLGEGIENEAAQLRGTK